MMLAASGAAAVAGVRLMRARRNHDLDRESEIDDRLAETFPASDSPWHP
jgi:hypothetical protein